MTSYEAPEFVSPEVSLENNEAPVISKEVENMALQILKLVGNSKLNKTISNKNIKELEKAAVNIFENCTNDILSFSSTELIKADFGPNDSFFDGMFYGAVLETLKTLSDQGHSGYSSSIMLSLLTRLYSFKPLSPLTGEDDEWVDISESLFQNKRASSVFKDKRTGRCYDSTYRIFIERDGGVGFSNSESRKEITFPYTIPETRQTIHVDSKRNWYFDELPLPGTPVYMLDDPSLIGVVTKIWYDSDIYVQIDFEHGKKKFLSRNQFLDTVFQVKTDIFISEQA